MSKRIEVNNLDVYYDKFKAVEDVNMVIEPRTVTAFIGPSCCGKSTFLRTLNRMHELVPGAELGGTIELDGVDIYGQQIAAAEARLAGSGRVLIRKSGTEPLIRVMAEAEDEVVLRDVVEEIVAAVETAASGGKGP